MKQSSAIVFSRVALLVSVLALPVGAAPDPLATHAVRVPAAAAAELAQLALTPATDLDLGSFRWLALDDADLARLEAAGIPFVPMPDARQVRVNGYRFDPLTDGEPALPAALASGGDGHLRLVQLDGPATDARLRRLLASGLRLLQYYPHHSYLVWASADAALRAAALPEVRWSGPFHGAYKLGPSLAGRAGRIDSVELLIVDDGALPATLAAVEQLGGELLQHVPAQPDGALYSAFVRLDAEALQAVARLDAVVAIGYQSPRPVIDDEMSAQIVAGNHPGGVPPVGYLAHLATLGVDGSGVIWSITDSGIDYDHPDLAPRIVGGFSYAGCSIANPGDASTSGHGTHVAGIVGGDGTAGNTDAGGFLYGLGVAPGVSLFAQNPICPTLASWPPAGGWQEMTKQAVLGGAIGANNSWTSGEGTAHGYQATERTHDIAVRDANFDTPGSAEPFTLVFSAGNSGPGAMSLTSPKDAKNLIVVANSLNFRAGSIDQLSGSSSRGPAVDGRWVPTVAAPGTTIASTRADTATQSCATSIGGTGGLYAFCSGTSMASPHAAGSVALITDWWRGLNAGADPSPAMARALLVNNATDMGVANIPNTGEGWGRVNVTRVILPPAAVVYIDQDIVFTNPGELWQATVQVDDPGQPLKITLAWSDAPGAVGANPALVNDLDLTVSTGNSTYQGNVFAAGTSTTGGAPDALNNLENVFVATPGTTAKITIEAINIAGDGVPLVGDASDQDFALVCTNCAPLASVFFADGFESGNTSAWALGIGL